ncbi:hypothetical protein H0H81_006394 [Sphagnurus paluster]|uniref:DUF6697 domain-containing protein n=1 Tax=Sphagnurus paluster TaxID=117069 RepID=A0A9P7K7Q4_9AGAR|nr:hypothetical protein H0H81_006394 [Sphagnurus paluster]
MDAKRETSPDTIIEEKVSLASLVEDNIIQEVGAVPAFNLLQVEHPVIPQSGTQVKIEEIEEAKVENLQTEKTQDTLALEADSQTNDIHQDDAFTPVPMEVEDVQNILPTFDNEDEVNVPDQEEFPKIEQDTIDKPRSQKRRRLLDVVEVPTVKSLYGKRIKFTPGTGQSIDELNEKMEKMKNPNAKKKEGRGLSLDTVRDRLLAIGLDPYPIPLEKDMQDFTVRREVMASHFGGGAVATTPVIGKKFFDKHGLDDFMYPNLDLNPHAPEVPGYPGLFFGCNGPDVQDKRPQVYRLITRLASAVWQYQGQYLLASAPPLTKAEWAYQSPKVHDTWARGIHKNDWGKHVRARIFLRKTLGAQYTPKALEKAMASSDKYLQTTEEEIKEAFIRGDEVMYVWTMKCVGYDVEFQRTIVENYAEWHQAWISRPKDPKKKKNGAEHRGDKKQPTELKSGRKRKRGKLVARLERGLESDIDDDDDENLGSEVEVEVEDPAGLHYRPRGTRSRPIVLSWLDCA